MSETGMLRWSDYRAMPWRNGGGTTREVASGTLPGVACGERGPGAEPSGPDAFDWRVSIADVDAGGPFSAFPGIDRVITLVEGSGMVLTVDSAPPRLVEPLTPFAFPGDARTDCRLEGGAVRDMNVMTRRGHASAHVRMVPVGDGGTEVTGAADEIVLVLAVTEGVVVDERGTATPLGRLDCARATPRLSLRGEGTVAEIRIAPAR
ncbi:HutD family protein [Streptomyces sp. SID11385]|uniref:HutD/Ves family protein n=1 Tax=Streptomyces sp. SID11385 TaxID=2706031 RepID=UPI0013CD656A|nr:HutD family protein [Streptomyces sp. SID11385]NEA41393.1 HutD family protein [Streptomyces sp. SID11385]